MIRIRYIKQYTREWVLVKTSSPDATCRLNQELIENGFSVVGIVKFLTHRLLWWRKPPNEES
jgi:hypothetical protein